MKKRFTVEQIIGFLSEAEAGMAVRTLVQRHRTAGQHDVELKNRAANVGD